MAESASEIAGSLVPVAKQQAMILLEAGYIWLEMGKYDKAKTALETALAARPDYAIAHENLGDVHTRLAGAQYEQALALDKTDKSAQAKLTVVRELYAVTPSAPAPRPAAPKPISSKPALKLKK